MSWFRTTALAALALTGLELVASACVPLGGPRLVSLSPASMATGAPTSAPIRITFDRATDHASVEHRFHLRALRDGGQEQSAGPDLALTAHWDGDSVLFDHPRLAVEHWYEGLLEGGFTDEEGIPNQDAHYWRFATEGPPQLSASAPSNGQDQVELDTDLRLAFSRPMDASASADSVTVEPALAFRVWSEPGHPEALILTPFQLLTPATRYAVTVSPSAVDRDGNHLAGPRRFAFTSAGALEVNDSLVFRGRPSQDSPGVWFQRPEQRSSRRIHSGEVAGIWWLRSSVLISAPDGDLRQAFFDGSPERSLGVSLVSPVPSPDGQLVAGVGSPEGHPVLELVDVASATVRVLVDPAPDGPIGWGAGSDKIFYVASVDAGPPGLWAVDVGLGAHFRITSLAAPALQLAVSPTGERIAVLEGSPGASFLWLVNAPAGGPGSERRIGPVADMVGWAAGTGRLIAVRPPADPQASPQVLSVPSDASDPDDVRVLSTLSPDTAPESLRLSASGRQLAQVRAAGGRSTIWLTGLDGSNAHPLVKLPGGFPGEVDLPAWNQRPDLP